MRGQGVIFGDVADERLEELADDERDGAAEPASRRRREGGRRRRDPGKDAGPRMSATSVDEPTPTARASATSQQQMRGVPIKAAMNLGFTMTTFIEFIVAMAFAGPCALSASMTQNEKMK